MNPLLSQEFLIPFDDIRAEHVEPGVREALENAQADLDAIINETDARTYDNTLGALSRLEERLDRAVGLGYHLTSVMNSPELREAFNAVLPEFSAFYAKLPLNDGLWQAVKEFSETDEAHALAGVKKRHLEKTMRAFVRAGADLPPDQKAKAEALSVELSQLQNEFSNHVLDATNAFELLITDESELSWPTRVCQSGGEREGQIQGQGGLPLHLAGPFLCALYAVRRRSRPARKDVQGVREPRDRRRV